MLYKRLVDCKPSIDQSNNRLKDKFIKKSKTNNIKTSNPVNLNFELTKNEFHSKSNFDIFRIRTSRTKRNGCGISLNDFHNIKNDGKNNFTVTNFPKIVNFEGNTKMSTQSDFHSVKKVLMNQKAYIQKLSLVNIEIYTENNKYEI